jgi:hypothetical protein
MTQDLPVALVEQLREKGWGLRLVPDVQRVRTVVVSTDMAIPEGNSSRVADLIRACAARRRNRTGREW